MAFLLHFKDDGAIQKNSCFLLVLSFIRCNVLYSPTFLSHVHELQSVSIQMVLIICISLFQGLSYRQLDLGPELQAVRFGYVILDENWKKRGGSIY
jgi:hypothetical protein